jgi:hypothetical protein
MILSSVKKGQTLQQQDQDELLLWSHRQRPLKKLPPLRERIYAKISSKESNISTCSTQKIQNTSENTIFPIQEKRNTLKERRATSLIQRGTNKSEFIKRDHILIGEKLKSRMDNMVERNEKKVTNTMPSSSGIRCTTQLGDVYKSSERSDKTQGVSTNRDYVNRCSGTTHSVDEIARMQSNYHLQSSGKQEKDAGNYIILSVKSASLLSSDDESTTGEESLPHLPEKFRSCGCYSSDSFPYLLSSSSESMILLDKYSIGQDVSESNENEIKMFPTGSSQVPSWENEIGVPRVSHDSRLDSIFDSEDAIGEYIELSFSLTASSDTQVISNRGAQKRLGERLNTICCNIFNST